MHQVAKLTNIEITPFCNNQTKDRIFGIGKRNSTLSIKYIVASNEKIETDVFFPFKNIAVP
jgi:hypothetical protein